MTRVNRHRRIDTAAHETPNAITDSIWWVGRSGWGGLPALTHATDCNIYLLKGESFDVLIDAGGNASVRKLERNVRLAGSDPDRVGEIWCTHSHLDHFVGAGHWIARHPRTRCRISHVAARFLRNGDERKPETAGQRKERHCMNSMPQALAPTVEKSAMRVDKPLLHARLPRRSSIPFSGLRGIVWALA